MTSKFAMLKIDHV